MTTPCHFALSYLLCDSFGAPPDVSMLCACLSALPDVAAYDETMRENWGGTYKFWHTWHWWMILLPPVALHVGLDAITHKPEGEWSTLGYVYEVVLDLSCAFYFLGRWNVI